MRCKFAVAVVTLSSFAAVSRVDGQACTVPNDCPQLQPGYVCPNDASLFPNLTDPVEVRMSGLGILLDGNVNDAIVAGATVQVDVVADEDGNLPGPTGDRESPRFPSQADPNGFNIARSVLLFVPDSNPLDGVDDSFVYVGWDISDFVSGDPESDGLPPRQYDTDDNDNATNLGGQNGFGVPCNAGNCPISDRLPEVYQVFLLAGADDDVFDPVLGPQILSDYNPLNILSAFDANVLMLNIDPCSIPLNTAPVPDTLITKAFPTADGVTNLSNDCIDLEIDNCAEGNNVELVIKKIETSQAFGRCSVSGASCGPGTSCPNPQTCDPVAPDSPQAAQNRRALRRLLASLHNGSEGDTSDEEVANVARLSPGCDFDDECDNANVCDGLETCVDNACVTGTPLVCGDGAFCNGSESCNPTLGCQVGAPPCNDGVACTLDQCIEATDSCAHTPDHGFCDNGLHCDGVESCHHTLGCQLGSPPNCADAFACTVDSCNESTDGCDHVPNNGTCSDGVFCNGAEVCNPAVGCQDGADPVCDDNLDCTTDSCSGITNQCQFTPVNAACQDNNPCTDNVCVVGVGCTFLNDNTNNCADTNLCNGTESCQNGTCVPGTPLACDDHNPCTDDFCNNSMGCIFQNDNSNPCGDKDGCHACASGECIVLGPQECDDGNPCTDDFCEPFVGCTSAPDPSNSCEDSDSCNGAEACDGLGACNRTLAADCNSNFIEDACDIPGGSPDANDNEIPDECEPGACCSFDGGCSVALQAGCASGTWHLDRSCDPNQCVFTIGVTPAGCRYFGVTPNPSGDPSTSIAIRVTSNALPCMTKYVILDSGIGRLADFAAYAPSSAWGAVQVADSELVPGTTYDIRVQTATATSDSVSVTLRQWGDVVAPFGMINFLDISADVDCFKHAAGAPPISACDVYPAVPDQDVSFLDISSVVDAFKGLSYPFAGPCP